ncbi:hypothetical protein Anapl_00270 [Anas platyrhynchos]|uniref:Uncharacterized protein n=1 Tax=Anas platyrhynchos TaxID=8839 RepID=R0M5Y0_ANAPL|nr:hypothetical protein Anapl_00270 [Anas platyrhynchos]
MSSSTSTAGALCPSANAGWGNVPCAQHRAATGDSSPKEGLARVDVGFSCESKNEKAVIPKQRLKTKPCPSPQPVGLWKGVCCYLGTSIPTDIWRSGPQLGSALPPAPPAASSPHQGQLLHVATQSSWRSLLLKHRDPYRPLILKREPKVCQGQMRETPRSRQEPSSWHGSLHICTKAERDQGETSATVCTADSLPWWRSWEPPALVAARFLCRTWAGRQRSQWEFGADEPSHLTLVKFHVRGEEQMKLDPATQQRDRGTAILGVGDVHKCIQVTLQRVQEPKWQREHRARLGTWSWLSREGSGAGSSSPRCNEELEKFLRSLKFRLHDCKAMKILRAVKKWFEVLRRILKQKTAMTRGSPGSCRFEARLRASIPHTGLGFSYKPKTTSPNNTVFSSAFQRDIETPSERQPVGKERRELCRERRELYRERWPPVGPLEMKALRVMQSGSLRSSRGCRFLLSAFSTPFQLLCSSL